MTRQHADQDFLLCFKGTYSIKDFHIDEDFLPNIVPAGEYICVVSFKINDIVSFGYNVYFKIKLTT